MAATEGRRLLRVRSGAVSTVPVALPVALGGPLLFAVVAVALVLAPSLLSGYQVYVVSVAFGYAVAALGMATAFNMLGLLALIQAAMMSIGGFAMVALMSEWGVALVPALLAGMLAAAVVSAVFAVATAGLTELAFAILGFAFTFLITLFLSGTLLDGISGGELGRSVPPGSVFGTDVTQGTNSYYFTVFVVLAAYGLAGLVLRSSIGRAILLVGRDPTVATSMGIDVARWRVATLAVVGAYGGLGGCLVAQATQYIAPPTFGPELAVILLAMALSGGVRYLLAGIVGMLALEAVPNMARMSVTDREILVGAVLFLVLVFFRDGILGVCFGLARRVRAALGRTEPSGGRT